MLNLIIIQYEVIWTYSIRTVDACTWSEVGSERSYVLYYDKEPVTLRQTYCHQVTIHSPLHYVHSLNTDQYSKHW